MEVSAPTNPFAEEVSWPARETDSVSATGLATVPPGTGGTTAAQLTETLHAANGPPWLSVQTLAQALAPVTEVESNDTAATATPLPLTEDPAGTGLWFRTALGAIQPNLNDRDFWSVSLVAGDRISANVDMASGIARPVVSLYSPTQVALTSNATDGSYFHSRRGRQRGPYTPLPGPRFLGSAAC